MSIGQVLPGGQVAIGLDTLTRLAKVAEWGKGSVQAVAFTPDGRSIVAGSAYGLAVYSLADLQAAPIWIAFDAPFVFDQLDVSLDGGFVRLKGWRDIQIRRLSDGQVTSADVAWPRPLESDAVYGDISVHSSDRTRSFRSQLLYVMDPDTLSEESVVREVYDEDRTLLYTLSDVVPYVTYRERMEPEGCDLGVFSPCGNALAPLARAPIRAAFAPSGQTLAVLYGVPSLSRSQTFNVVRVYSADDGEFLMSIGGLDSPVVDFGYSPDSSHLVIGTRDGSVQLWDLATRAATFGARHFNAPIDAVAYTPDSRFLLIQRGAELEIRRSLDGALIAREVVEAFDVSPTDGRIAIADLDHTVRIISIDTGEIIQTLPDAHSDRIYTLTFSPDGSTLASAGRDCDLKLWDLSTGKLLHYFEETRLDPYEIDMTSRPFMYAMAFIPKTDLVVGFGSWGTVVAWSVNSGAMVYQLQSPPLEYYNGMVTVKPHFPEVVDVDLESKTFYIDTTAYDLLTGQLLADRSTAPRAPSGCTENGPLTADGRLYVTRGYGQQEGTLCVLDADTRGLLVSIPMIPGRADDYFLGWPFLSPDGRQLLVTTEAGIVFVYQVVP